MDGAFRVLIPLFLLIDGSSEIVLPPTNLTLSCDNFNVTARWEYEHLNTKFKVQIKDDPRSFETTDHHFDLSPSVWKSKEDYLGVHYVSVTAILGENQSNPVLSESLTYNKLKSYNILCTLVFPPVDVTVVDGEVIVTFRNPHYFYKYLRWNGMSDTTDFKFSTINEDGVKFEGKCHTEDCEKKISFKKNESRCVTLSGQLCDQPDFRCLEFSKTDLICPDEPLDLLWILFGVIMFAIITVSVLTILICWTKSWTFKVEEPSPPKPLVHSPTNKSKPFFTPDESNYSAVTVINTKPCKISQLGLEEKGLLGNMDRRDNPGAEDPNNFYIDGEALENSNQGQDQEYSSTDEDSPNNSIETESVEMDLEMDREEEQELEENGDWEVRSPYDCPHNLTF